MRTRTKVADGIYRDSQTGNLCWRPKVNGKWTWRKLHAPTVRVAKEERARLIIDRIRKETATGIDPLSVSASNYSVPEVCREYLAGGCPDRKLRTRSENAIKQDSDRIKQILRWKSWPEPERIDQPVLDRYASFRQKTCRRGHGGRAVDLELNTLKNAVQWAARLQHIPSNPFLSFKRAYYGKPESEVLHCRERMPRSAEELHSTAQAFFETRTSEVFGWQMLFEAFTGCRTNESIRLRTDAPNQHHPGFIKDGVLWIARDKGGVNNFIHIGLPLEALIKEHRRWLALRFPNSPWYFPSPHKPQTNIGPKSLTNALRDVSKALTGRQITSHGLRAFYVTVRRSQGANDGTIALEIGQRSGGREILKTYGDVLPVKLDWMPEKGGPAWRVFEKESNVIPMLETSEKGI